MKKNKAILISLIATVLGLLIGFVVVFITGRNPIDMLLAFVKSLTGFDVVNGHFNIVYVLNWFLESVPLILTGLAIAFAYRTGLFNIGVEGQYMVGAAAASMAALLLSLPPVIHVIVCVLAGMLAGALWGAIPGILKAYRNIHEVVICIMLNYVGMYFANILVRYLLPIDDKTNAKTIAFGEGSVFAKVVEGSTSQFNWGFLIAVLAVILVWFIIEKTSFGFSLKATGFNKDAAEFSGMKVNKNIITSMMISGALAGAAGAVVILGTFKYGRIFVAFDGYGFTGIAVALVGAANAIGVALAGLLFGLLKACTGALQLNGIPKEISDLIQACIIYFVAIQYGIVLIVNKLKAKKAKKALETEEGGRQS
ncbi:MAG: ABC transporter permease [Erysipelotrichaceae bacterium]